MPGNRSLMHVSQVICFVCYSKAASIYYLPAVREMEVEVSQRSPWVAAKGDGGSIVLDESPVHSFPLTDNAAWC